MSVAIKTISMLAEDEYLLSGTLFTGSSAPKAALLINSGTGISQRLYAKFARYAAEQGFVVLTFDYRGVGASAPKDLKGFKAAFRDWGQLDVVCAIDWLKQNYPKLPLAAVCHSKGGQLLGLAHNLHHIDAAVFAAAGTGYWKPMQCYKKWLSYFFWHFYNPITNKLFKYLPAKVIGFGENLPSGVALELGSWCLEPKFMKAFFDDTGHRRPLDGRPFGQTYFSQAQFPIRGYYFTDDGYTTKGTVMPLRELYANSDFSINWVKPSDLNCQKIDHLGFFLPRRGGTLWEPSLQWLSQQFRIGYKVA